jgi:Spherulation-specific family 4
MRRFRLAIVLTAALALVFGLAAAAPAQASGEHIVTTLYAYPTLSSWQQVEAAAPTVSAAIVDICAPDGSGSGCNGQPADAESTVWVPTIQALDAAGVQPLYYIWTDYGGVPLATVESELLNAIGWYGVASPMFDGTSTSASEVSYYQALYSFAIAHGAKTVMFNPGIVAPQSYMFGPNEILQQFEGTEAQFQATAFPSWMTSYPPSEFSATISSGTAAGVGTDVSDAVSDGIGNVYVNDEAQPPNYSTLPAFWSAEVQDVAAATPNPAVQTITFPNPGPGTAGQTATLTATGGGSGNPVVFSVDATSGAGVCSVSGTDGSTVTYLAAGTCVIDANQAGGNGYAAAPQVQQTITVTASGAPLLAFTTEPGGGADGTAWAQQPVVSVEGAGGTVVTGNTSAVTLSIASQPGSGATLSCAANPVTATAGVASFSGCQITGEAGTYTLQATGGGLEPAASGTFSVTVGAPARLAFTTQPGGAGSGVSLGAQPAVSVEDSGGNVVTGNSSAVSLAIASQPGTGATLSCTANPVTATAGIAAFAGCKITGMAGSYTLTATDGSLTAATSGTVSVTAGAAAQLAFTSQPGGGANGAAWSAQPLVAVQDSAGNLVTGSSASVTLAIASQPGTGATLSCTKNPVAATAGIASFAGCKITGEAGNYTLKATASGLTSAASGTFTVTVGAAAKLVFTTQPGGGTSGAAWPTQPKVSVEDSGGNVVTTGSSAVTLAIASQPGSGARLRCTTNPVTTSAGVAAFAGCTITGTAGSYTVKATDGSLTSTTSSSFHIAG